MQLKTKDRPIIFSTEMVRALLDGRKFQTRRLIKPQPERPPNGYPGASRDRLEYFDKLFESCKYGKVGDKLWVREKIYCFDGNILPKLKGDDFDNLWCHGCDYATNIEDTELVTKTISPIFMPRWCCRIELVLAEVSIERVGDISWPDAIAEGLEIIKTPGLDRRYKFGNLGIYYDPGEAFVKLWDSINTTAGTKFEDNPWVWVLKFEVKN
jgi:hypothetical protein